MKDDGAGIDAQTEVNEDAGVEGEASKPLAKEYKQSSQKEVKAHVAITRGMSDSERYEALKDRVLSLSAHANSEKLISAQQKLKTSEADIEFSKYGDKKRLFKKLGDEFGVFSEYSNSDIKLDFRFSKGNMEESVNKQKHNYIMLAKMLTCLDSVVENAIGIEVHNRNQDGYKADPTLKNVYVLASAFVDGEDIVPVKLEIKEFSDKENALYVAIALESIKKDGIVRQEVAENGVARQVPPPSDISIAEFFKKINPLDESFYKYIPKPFFEAKISYSKKTSKATMVADPQKTQAASEAQQLRQTNRQLVRENRSLTKERDSAVEKKAKAEEKLQQEKVRRKEAETFDQVKNRVLKAVRGITNWKKGEFESAAEANGDALKGVYADASAEVIRAQKTVEETYQSYTQPQDMRFHNLKYIEKVADNIGSLTYDQSHSAESTSDASTTAYSISDLCGFVKHQPNSQNNSDSIYCIENHTERNRYDTLYGKKRRFDL